MVYRRREAASSQPVMMMPMPMTAGANSYDNDLYGINASEKENEAAAGGLFNNNYLQPPPFPAGTVAAGGSTDGKPFKWEAFDDNNL